MKYFVIDRIFITLCPKVLKLHSHICIMPATSQPQQTKPNDQEEEECPESKDVCICHPPNPMAEVGKFSWELLCEKYLFRR